MNASNPLLGTSPASPSTDTYTDDHVAHGDNAFATAPSTDGDMLSYRAPLGGPRFVGDNWSVSHATGWTVEFRLKIDDDFAEGPAGAFQVVLGDGTNGDIVRVGKSKFAGQETVVIDSNSNTDAYHTFRIALTGGTNVINMWRDDVLAHTFPGGGNFSGNLLFWASGGSTVGGPTVHLDYFRWDNTGAYEPSPVPEPGALILVTIGTIGLAVIARRADCEFKASAQRWRLRSGPIIVCRKAFMSLAF